MSIQRHGISFSYLGNWKIGEESNGSGIPCEFVETHGNAIAVTLPGQEVPGVRTHWSKEIAGQGGFLLLQAATEDWPKVEAGFGPIAETLEWEAVDGDAPPGGTLID